MMFWEFEPWAANGRSRRIHSAMTATPPDDIIAAKVVTNQVKSPQIIYEKSISTHLDV